MTAVSLYLLGWTASTGMTFCALDLGAIEKGDAEMMKTFWGIFTSVSMGKSQLLQLCMQNHFDTWKILQLCEQVEMGIWEYRSLLAKCK